MDEITSRALDAAVAAGATYADVRAVDLVTEALAVRDDTVESLERAESIGFGVRVLVDGAWGYASSARLEDAEAATIAKEAVEVARASATAISQPVELVDEPTHEDSWTSDRKSVV